MAVGMRRAKHKRGPKGNARVTSVNMATPSEQASVSRPSYMLGVRARGRLAYGTCAKGGVPCRLDSLCGSEGSGGSASAVLCVPTSSSGAA